MNKFPEIKEIENELNFIGHPLNDKMDHGLRVEHAEMAKNVLKQLEKKLQDWPDTLLSS